MSQRSGLALAVLALAAEEPMHPYRMQQLIRRRGKDQVVNVGQRSQLYRTIDRLVRDDLLAARGTERPGTRPERTVYAATDAGRDLAVTWTVEMLTTPRPEFGEFTAGLAYLPLLAPTVATEAIARRLTARRDELVRMRGELEQLASVAPRVVLIDNEYAVAQLEAEVDYLAGLHRDLARGRLTWNDDDLRAAARRTATDPLLETGRTT